MRNWILNAIDFFYPPFRMVIPLQTFRYAACGGFNTALDICLYVMLVNFVFIDSVIMIGAIAMKPHIAALVVAFSISFPLGFLLNRYVVFTESNLRGRVQFIRYLLMVLACIVLNYVFLKLFVEYLQINPTLAKLMTTFIVVGFSYVSQKHFTFKVRALKVMQVESNNVLERLATRYEVTEEVSEERLVQ